MNVRRILSKSSLKSSTSSGKSLHRIDEIKKLQDEVELFKLNISSLKVLLENRDAAIGTLAGEKEKVFVELKSLQRSNRNLERELVEERVMRAREKELLGVNLKRLSVNLTSNNRSNEIIREEEYILALKHEIESKDEVIYNVCSKYFKLKKSKETLQNKLVSLQRYTQETFETIMQSLDDNRVALNLLLDELNKSEKNTPSRKKYIKLLKTNADLNFENAQLKLCLIPKAEFDTNDGKAEMEASVITIPGCSHSNQYGSRTTMIRRKSTFCIEPFLRCSKSSASKVIRMFYKLKNIRAYHKPIHYRSMSDTLLPKNVYK